MAFEFAYGPPVVDPSDGKEVLIERYSIEIATMTDRPEPHLYNHAGGVVLRDGTFSHKDAREWLHNRWFEHYLRYTSPDEFDIRATEQIALWVANDQEVTKYIRVQLRYGGARKARGLAPTAMSPDFRSFIDEEFGGLDKVCWLTVARELSLR